MNFDQDRITIDPQICIGKPVIRGKRVSVQTVLEFLSAGDSVEDVLQHYPALNREDIYACLRFATSVMDHNYVIAPVVAT